MGTPLLKALCVMYGIPQFVCLDAEGLDDVRNRLHIERVFEPSADKEKQVQRYKGWKKAVSRALQWIDVED